MWRDLLKLLDFVVQLRCLLLQPEVQAGVTRLSLIQFGFQTI